MRSFPKQKNSLELLLSTKNFLRRIKLGLIPLRKSVLNGILVSPQNQNPMGKKSSHFIGQPMLGQLLKLIDRSKILEISREKGGERYVKRFNCWVHLVVMLFAEIKRFDSLSEITAGLLGESRKLCQLGIGMKTSKSTLADANKRRPEAVFEGIYRHLYGTYRQTLSSDSRTGNT